MFEMKRRMNPEETRERVVRAAGEVFGRHGFDGTTIRQITKRAGVNVAAVNYHFRDKAELYLRVLREAKHRQVLMQEMMRPTPALDLIVREMTEPIHRRLRAIIAAVVGTKLPGAKLDMLTCSVLGQCLFYVRSQPMLERLAPELNRGEDRAERIADHIATFSLAALCNLYKNKGNSSRTEPASQRAAATNRRVPALLVS
jgi:AcrR family transcriptional regulator